MGVLFGEPGGCSPAVTLERKKMYIWAPSVRPRGHLKLGLRAIRNVSKEQGSTELISVCGAQRGRL